MTRRVLFFGDTHHRVAGAQKSLLAALERIAAHDIVPLLVFPGTGPFEALCRARGVAVEVIDAGPAFQTFNKALLRLPLRELARVLVTDVARMARDLARLADRWGADVLHFNAPRGVVMAGGAAQLTGRPSVLHVRGMIGMSRPAWFASQLLSDSFVLVAERILECMAPSSRARATVIHDGIAQRPPAPRAEARARTASWLADRGHRVDPDARWAVSLSTPTPWKGLHVLLEAAQQLDRTRPHRITWILAGKGPGDDYERWLARRIGELGLAGKVHLVGFVEDVHALLSAADVFVLPSLTDGRSFEFDGQRVAITEGEGLPMAVLEALAAGIPVVATDSGGVREVVERGRTGFVLPPGDAQAFAEAVDDVLSDPRWPARVAEEGPRGVSGYFTVEGATRRFADALHAASPRALRVRRAQHAIALTYDALLGREAGQHP